MEDRTPQEISTQQSIVSDDKKFLDSMDSELEKTQKMSVQPIHREETGRVMISFPSKSLIASLATANAKPAIHLNHCVC